MMKRLSILRRQIVILPGLLSVVIFFGVQFACPSEERGDTTEPPARKEATDMARGSEKGLFSLASSAGEKLYIENNGVLHFGELTFEMDYRDQNKSTSQSAKSAVTSDPGYPRIEQNEQWTLEGSFLPFTLGSPLAFHETLQRESPSTLKLAFRLAESSDSVSQSGSEALPLRLMVHLPVDVYATRSLKLDGQLLTLPEAESVFALKSQKVKHISIPVPGGVLNMDGNFKVLIADSRIYKIHFFNVIVESVQRQRVLPERTLEFSLSFEPYRFDPIDMHRVANMDFSDEVSGDDKGGWTDQGKDHDLHMMPVGDRVFAEVPFSILSPEKNNSKTCLVFAGPQRANFLHEAKIDLDNKPYRSLFLLHAFGWDQKEGTELGRIEVTFADGHLKEFPVLAHREASNWTAPYDAPNGQVAWKCETATGWVGLNLSIFDLPGTPIRALRLIGSGNAVWMVAGITASPDTVALMGKTRNVPLVIKAGPDWQPIDQPLDVVPGSILDFSALLDAPAGKYGRVQVRNGHFVFEKQPDKAVRFFGIDLVWKTNLIDHALADTLSKRLAMMGYNAVRLHHYDGDLLKTNAKSNADIDPVKLDRLDYLVASLEKRGIYYTTDLYVDRTFFPGEIAGIRTNIRRGIIPLVTVSPSALHAWEQYAIAFLGHKNPYTGHTYADDPALLGLCPINENALSVFWSTDAAAAQIVRRHFEEWKQQEGKNDADHSSQAMAFTQYLSELQMHSRQVIADFLREKLHLQAPLTDVNHQETKTLIPLRQNLDYVDCHSYWDHPKFVGTPWLLPYMYTGEPATRHMAQVPRVLFPVRIPNKPFAITEFNYSYPNQYRAESGPLMGAYGAFQDWDAIFRFNYAGTVDALSQTSPIISLNTVEDPIIRMADRLISLLFLRGDVRPAKNMIVYEANPKSILSSPENAGNFSEPFSQLGLITGLGSGVAGEWGKPSQQVVATVTQQGTQGSDPKNFQDSEHLVDDVLQSGVLPASLADLKAKIFHSDTGEITLDSGSGLLSVITPKTEAFMLSKAGSLTGSVVDVTTDTPAMVSVSAMDGKPLVSSQHLLILHLTDVQNTGIRFRDVNRRILESWGNSPQLVEKGTAEIFLKMNPAPNASMIAAWALDVSGQRLRPVPTLVDAKGVHLKTQTVEGAKTALAYEISISEKQPLTSGQ